jgi:hypothetical protein
MKVKTYILLLIMAAIVAACTKDATGEEVRITEADDMVPVTFTVSNRHIIDYFTRSAASIVTFEEDEKVRVMIKPLGSTEDYSQFDFTAHEAAQGTKLDAPTPPPYFPAGDNSKVEAYAYYPYDATTTFTVQDDQTADADYKASDLMFAANRIVTKKVDDGNNVLTMDHLMAQLKITANAQVGTGLVINSVTVLAKKGVTFTPQGETVSTTIPASTGIVTALKAAGTGYIVIPPQEIEGLTITVTTGGGTAAETATYVFSSESSFQAGLSYGINLTVTPEHLGRTSFINEWNGTNSVNVTPSGDLIVEPINAVKLEYTGYAHEPAVVVKKDGYTPSVPASLYDVQYINNTDAGKAFVLVIGKGELDGCIGVASFTIAQANAEISYASDTETKTYGNPKFTKPLTNTGDGLVTYTSSNEAVATVDANTGEVTIQKSGTTTITANVENGANFVYSPDKKSASYTLTVNAATGTITFASARPSLTWSSTTANNTFTQEVTNTGTAPVTYSIDENINDCEATIEGSTVTFQKPGQVLVIATVTNDDRYSYTKSTARYLLTVNKANGYVTLTSNAGSVRAGSSATITVNTSHGGTLSAQATSGATGRVASISGPVDKKFTVATNGTAASSATITVTCAANDYYNAATATYTLTIEPTIDIWKNPLYYMAEYNVANQAGTSFATSSRAGYYFSWYDAMAKFAAQTTSYTDYRNAGKGPNGQWHLPVKTEWWSIIPGAADIFKFDNGSGTYKPSYIQPVWGYNNMTKNSGILESSYWRKVSNSEIHAIRFLGTEFCSIWKYEMLGGGTSSNCTYLRISSVLIPTVANNASSASAWYASNINSVVWSNDESRGAVQRTIYALGLTSREVGTAANATMLYGINACYWVVTHYENQSENRGYHLSFLRYHFYIIPTDPNGKRYGMNVLLFRDH